MRIFLTILIVLFFSLTKAAAQQPIMKVDDKDSNKVQLNSLKVEVKIVANIAITTMEMEFCNKSNRVLTGELTFPLPESVSINRYALDMYGTMREAVPVEREKGQVAFENIIRQKVDPGLLEKVEGNSFRTRIYTLPANGCRKIIVGYQQTLFANDINFLTYSLPLQSKKAIAHFSVNMNVFSKNAPEIGKDCNTKIQFTQRKNVYNASFEEKNFIPKGSFEINIPKLSEGEDVLMQKVNNQYYFLINHFPEKKILAKKTPTYIQLVWDHSFSGAMRNHVKEIDFVKAYIKKMGTGTVAFSTIGYTFKNGKNYTITNGECVDLITELKKMTYDGATNLSLIDWNRQAEEHLLISDGLNSWGNLTALKNAPKLVNTITDASTANFSNLNFIAHKNGGQFINLNSFTIEKAVQQLSEQTLRLVNVKMDNTVSEVYPSYGIVKGNMAISGISTSSTATIELEYGTGTEVLFTEKVLLSATEQNTEDIALDKIWAQQKINQLDEQYDLFKTQIEDLGKQYTIVTRNTSLIVLDNVDDYVKYKIAPPAELRAAYDSIITAKNEALQQEFKNILEDAKSTMNVLKEWYNKDFTPKVTLTVVDHYDGKMLGDVNIHVNGKNYTTDKNGQVTIRDIDTVNATVYKQGYTVERVKLYGYEQQQETVLLKNPVHKGKRKYVEEDKKAPSPVKKTEMIQYTPPRLVTDSEKAMLDYAGGETNAATFSVSLNATSKGLVLESVQVSAVPFLSANTPQKKGSFEIKEIKSNKPFIKTLETTPVEKRYAIYLRLREEYMSTPTFFFEVANFFAQQGDKETAMLILSNVADMNLEDHELYKMLGYQLKKWEQYDEAKNVFKKVLQWRPQEPQSYRDYALALQDIGLYQNAFDTLYTALTRQYDTELYNSYHGIEETILMEINQMIVKNKSLNTSKIDGDLIEAMPVDIRVVLNWNMNDSDMDLWVIDPRGEKCFYSNQETKIGGRISDDFTSGYGPEQFILNNAKKGKYQVKLHYYGDGIQKIAGGTTVMAEVFTNYGRPNEVRKLITLQLEKGEDREGILVGEFSFE